MRSLIRVGMHGADPELSRPAGRGERRQRRVLFPSLPSLPGRVKATGRGHEGVGEIGHCSRSHGFHDCNNRIGNCRACCANKRSANLLCASPPPIAHAPPSPSSRGAIAGGFERGLRPAARNSRKARILQKRGHKAFRSVNKLLANCSVARGVLVVTRGGGSGRTGTGTARGDDLHARCGEGDVKKRRGSRWGFVEAVTSGGELAPVAFGSLSSKTQGISSPICCTQFWGRMGRHHGFGRSPDTPARSTRTVTKHRTISSEDV